MKEQRARESERKAGIYSEERAYADNKRIQFSFMSQNSDRNPIEMAFSSFTPLFILFSYHCHKNYSSLPYSIIPHNIVVAAETTDREQKKDNAAAAQRSRLFAFKSRIRNES
jgi:hypothetical protein